MCPSQGLIRHNAGAVSACSHSCMPLLSAESLAWVAVPCSLIKSMLSLLHCALINACCITQAMWLPSSRVPVRLLVSQALKPPSKRTADCAEGCFDSNAAASQKLRMERAVEATTTDQFKRSKALHGYFTGRFKSQN